jgi:iron complex outermembrane receptor protein
VSDADEKKPLENASLRIKELNLAALTDAEGHYHFYNICPGFYTFIVTHTDCDTITVRLRIESNTVRNFSLPHYYNQLAAVQVMALKDNYAQQVKEEISKKDIAETRGQALGEILRKVTGITVLQTGSTIFKPVIHGLHSQRVILVNNGVRLEGQQWGSEHAPEIDPYIADRFIVLKGAGAIRYGSDAIAGAILVEPKPLPVDQRLNGELNSAYFTNNRQYVTNLQVEQNLKSAPSFSWRTNVTYKRGGNARTPNYWLNNTGIKEFSIAGMAGYRKAGFRADIFVSAFSTQLGIFTGSHIGNLTDLQNAIASERPLLNIDKFSYTIDRPYQAVQHYLGKLRLFWSAGNGHRWQLVMSHQENNRSEYDRALITNRPELSLSIGTSSLEINRETTRLSTRSRNWGIQTVYQQNVWSGSRFFIPNFRAINGGLYLIEKWQTNQWAFEAAVRLDYRSLLTFRNRNGASSSTSRQFFNPSSTFSISRQFSSNIEVRSNTTLSWRAPQVNELYVNGLHHGTASFEIGDSSFTAERSLKQLLEGVYQKDSSWLINITFHTNLINSFINLQPSLPPTLTLRGAYPTFRYTQTNALLAGTDFKFEHLWNRHWKTSIKGSLLWARDLTQKDWLAQMPAHRVEAQFDYMFSSSLLKGSYISPSFLHVMRQTRIPKGQIDYLPPPKAYTLLNLNFASQLKAGRHYFSINMAVYNIMNIKYRDYMNRFRYFNDEVGRNFVLQLKFKL